MTLYTLAPTLTLACLLWAGVELWRLTRKPTMPPEWRKEE